MTHQTETREFKLRDDGAEIRGVVHEVVVAARTDMIRITVSARIWRYEIKLPELTAVHGLLPRVSEILIAVLKDHRVALGCFSSPPKPA